MFGKKNRNDKAPEPQYKIPMPPKPPPRDNKVIYVCSPFKGDIAANIERAREHCKTILQAGYMPYAAHIALNGVLDDNNPPEREAALKIGEEMVKRCNEVWVFGDHISEGMKWEIEAASKHGIPIRFSITAAQPSTVEKWIEQELSPERYNEFIKTLTAENDHDHPSYEEWRQELEPEAIKEAEEMKQKGELA